MKVAVEGCAHGELDNIYESLRLLEENDHVRVDLLICCGDFQASRNEEDLLCMAIPEKYYNLCSFYKYYNGEKVAPLLTIFIGGNHEASNYLQELPYGGWVAPNIYYLGYAGVINVAGIRIAGLSGIYKGQDYRKGRFEIAPYNDNTKRSVYHVRNLEVFRLKQLSEPIDVMLSHDWPTGITNYGDCKQLIKFKPFFKQDIKSGELGSPPCEELLNLLKPSYWFAAHLHCKFAALVPHPDGKRTKFLSLDKCLPNRRFLQILDVPHDANLKIKISYDLEWLSILRTTNHLLSVKKTLQYMPGPGSNERYCFTPTKEELDFVLARFDYDLGVPENFTRTTPGHGRGPSTPRNEQKQPSPVINPQTIEFCNKLSIDDPVELVQRSSVGPNESSLTADSGRMRSFIEDSEVFVEEELDDLLRADNDSPFRRGKLSLPVPKNEDIEENSAQTDSEEVIEKATPSCLVDPKVEEVKSGIEESGEAISPRTGTPINKKLKRRNAEIYSAKD